MFQMIESIVPPLQDYVGEEWIKEDLLRLHIRRQSNVGLHVKTKDSALSFP